MDNRCYCGREHCTIDKIIWIVERGAAWAFQQAMGLIWYYINSHPRMAELGRSTLNRIVMAPEFSTK